MGELYDLPAGWEWKKLDDVTTELTSKEKAFQCQDKPYLSLENIESYTGNIINYQTVKESNIIGTCSNFNSSSVIYSKLRPYLNKVATPNFDGAGTTELIVFLPEKNLDRYFLAHFLRSTSVVAKINASSYGSKMPRASSKFLRQVDFPLPPLPEQQRIVSKLDLLFEKIDRSIALHQKNMDEADLFMGSVLNDVFGELEEKYEKDFLSNYCQITSSKRVYKSDYVEDGIIFYRIKDIVLMSKNLPITDSQYIKKEAFDEFDKKFGSPKSGDILLTAVGATLGYTYLVTDSDGEFYFKDGNLLWLKNINNLDRKYLLHTFQSPLFDNYLGEISKGAAQPAITIIKLKEFKIPIPPLQIQQKVVSYLDEISEKIEKIKSVQKEKMDSLKALKASILDQAFRGEL